MLLRPIAMAVGVYSSSELTQMGVDRAELRRRIRDGTVERLRPGWYRSAVAVPDVVEAVRAGGVLSCVSALRHHGIWMPPGHQRIHVRATRHGKRSGRFCQGPGPSLPARTAIDPIPVALGCAARCLSGEEWVVVCDSVLNTTDIDPPTLQEQMGAVPQWLRELMSRCDGAAQSGTESMVRLRLRAAGFRVHVQPQIPGVGRVDLRVGRLLIECDSQAHHTSLENYRNDRRRDRQALLGRWLTMRITYDDVLYGWDQVIADIRAVTRPDRHRSRAS